MPDEKRRPTRRLTLRPTPAAELEREAAITPADQKRIAERFRDVTEPNYRKFLDGPGVDAD